MSDDQSLSSKNSHATQVSSTSTNPFRDSSNSTSGDSSQQRETYQIPEVAKQEEANIRRAKILVALILLLAVSSVGTSTYLLVKDQEKTNFENRFEGYSSEITTVSRQKADQLFSALDAFSASIASQAASENALRNTSWPYYAIPDWSIKAQRLVKLIGVSNPQVFFAPIVQPEERNKFNEFAQQAVPKWYQESVKNEKTEMTATEFWQKTIPFVHFFDPDNNFQPTPISGNHNSRPLFQTYPLEIPLSIPVMGTMYDTALAPNADILATISEAIRKPTMGMSLVYAGSEDEYLGSLIIQPIFDTANTHAEDRKMVGGTGIRLHWMDYFKNILTDDEFGIIVVLESSCPNLSGNTMEVGGTASSVASYRIDGQNAEYLDDSDVHNPKYDDMEIAEVFVDLGIDESQIQEDICIPTLTVRLYPSEDLEQSFQTSNAIIYTAVVAVIFIFTSLVFLLYDHFVRKRQKKVMERIMRQDKIVSNVFPTAIRDRLYQNQEKQKNPNDSFHDLEFEEDSHISGSAPLADLFPSITVVFADISGFTAWSSAREPQQVFVLLETIYSAFDKIAYRHNVFKVETVGDCYVAAAGVPEPVDKHVVIACKFARDCLRKMKEATLKLEVTLGPDTGDLNLRIGINR
eukprot:scaffold918_cov126-Cylindrotheca_fusiformis.AAC.69